MEIDVTNLSQEYWEEVLSNLEVGGVLDEDDQPIRGITYSMDRASLGEPQQRDAVLEYLEINEIEAVPSSEVGEGFQTSDEISENYAAEAERT